MLKGKSREWWLSRVTPNFKDGTIRSNYSGDVIDNRNDGYRYVTLSEGRGKPKVTALHHRLIWFLFHGTLLESDVIDHIDGDRLNNSIENLRIATVQENNQNRSKAGKNSSTGLLGVIPKGKKFIGAICKDRKIYRSELFDTALEAHQWYLGKKEEFHFWK